MSDIVKISTLPPKLAETASVAMHVCPRCRKPVRFNQSIMCQGGLIIYHAACWNRRGVQ